MSRQKLSQHMIGMMLVLLFFVGCGSPVATPTSVPPTDIATSNGAKTYYVDVSSPNSRDTNQGLSQEQPFRTIARVLEVLGPGDIAFIKAGLYQEAGLRFSRSGEEGAPITLSAFPTESGFEEIVIDGGGYTEGTNGILIGMDQSFIEIVGITIQQMPEAGIATDTSSHLDINVRNVVVRENRVGISLSSVDGFELNSVEALENSEDGILLANATNGSIINSHSHDNNSGILLLSSSNNVLEDNAATNNLVSGFFLLSDSNDNILRNNIAANNVSENDAGDPEIEDGITIIDSHRNSILGSEICGNGKRGLQLTDQSGENIVENNIAHHNGVLGFAIYVEALDNTLRGNLSHDNAFHGFVVLSGASGNTVEDNESFGNHRSGFYFENATDNVLMGNRSYDNEFDGFTMFLSSANNQFQNNEAINNGGFGYLTDFESPNGDLLANNGASENGAGDYGEVDFASVDFDAYTDISKIQTPPVCSIALSAQPTETTTKTRTIVSAKVIGEPVYFPRFGDLWLSTWAENDRLYMSWGDGTAGDCYPICESSPSACVVPENPCGGAEDCPEPDLYCDTFGCNGECVPLCKPTDAGLLELTGSLPDLSECSESLSCIASSHIPGQSTGWACDPASRDDKPSSLLALDGRIVWSGHTWEHEGEREWVDYGYLAWSDDDGRTWHEVPDSPWHGDAKAFRIMMFINMGRGYELNRDGYVYALAMGSEAGWSLDPRWSWGLADAEDGTVYLARVPRADVIDYNRYEYFTSMDGEVPSWSTQPTDATPLANIQAFFQGSAMYHPGVGQYLFLTAPPGALYAAPNPWGPWRKVAELFFQDEEEGPYGYVPGVITKDTGPDSFWFAVVGPTSADYNLRIGRIQLELADE